MIEEEWYIVADGSVTLTAAVPLSGEGYRRELKVCNDELAVIHLVWLSMLMFVFEVLVHQKGKDSAWQDIKQLADDYFGGLSPEEEALIRRGNDPANKIH